MQMWEMKTCDLEGVGIFNPFYTEDSRGAFIKDYEKEIYMQWGIDGEISETFVSYSKKNVIRGLHFQLEEPQDKIVNVLYGCIYDVVVDLRKNSNTFGRWKMIELSHQNRRGLFIPRGYAHGFCVKSDQSIVCYKCIGPYKKNSDSGILWNDKELNIPWGIKRGIVSERDKGLMTFKEFKDKYSYLSV